MDVHPNVSVSGALSAASAAENSFLGDISNNMEGGQEDISVEWLSIFVEDCLSSTTTYYNPIQPFPKPTSTTSTTPQPSPPLSSSSSTTPSKSRAKRRKISTKPQLTLSEPLLLLQTPWLADSELIFPKETMEADEEPVKKAKQEQEQHQQQPRRCSHCLSHRTPQWRAGPLGPKTLCNACGVRFKSGRLLPEYRPAKSPTFVSYKHSNSHKKVMEMRMGIMSANAN